MLSADLHSRAAELDRADPLAQFRQNYYINDGQIYLDGNSLGLASTAAETAVLNVLKQWRELGIEGWTNASPPWLSYTENIAAMLAPLLGANADEIAVGNSTTVNLHQLLATLYKPSGKRTKILVDALSFPSNLYAIASHLHLHNLEPDSHLVMVSSRDRLTISEADIVACFSDDIQAAVLPSVLFQSGQLLDLKTLTTEAHKHGIIVGVDCSHSAGIVGHEFDSWGTDFAYWCTYKYLNSGPGGTSALYLNRKHFGSAPGLAGWFGSRKERQFSFAPDFEPAPTASSLEIGTPNILSMAPLLGTLQQFSEAGINRIREKSLKLTDFLIECFDTYLAGCGFEIVTPREPLRRGGHISVTHPQASQICLALRAHGVVTDFRPPAMIRVTPSPLYTSFGDVCEAVNRLKDIVETKWFEKLDSETSVI